MSGDLFMHVKGMSKVPFWDAVNSDRLTYLRAWTSINKGKRRILMTNLHLQVSRAAPGGYPVQSSEVYIWAV